jgi:hypothetical protein
LPPGRDGKDWQVVGVEDGLEEETEFRREHGMAGRAEGGFGGSITRSRLRMEHADHCIGCPDRLGQLG